MQDLIDRTLALAKMMWPDSTETVRTLGWIDGEPVLTLMFARTPGWTDSAISVRLYAGRWAAEELWCLGEPHFAYAPYRRGDIDIPMSAVQDLRERRTKDLSGTVSPAGTASLNPTTCPEYQEGELPAFTLLGGYTVVYLTTDYDSLCANCANEEALGDIISWYLAEECDTEEALYCDECGMKLKEEEV